MRERSNGMVLSDGELDELAATLEKVGEVADRLGVAVCAAWPTRSSGPRVHVAPSSRAPYNLGAQDLLDELCNELGTVVRHMCEHRKVEPEQMGVEAAAAWIRKHRVGIAVMADGREIAERLVRTIERCARSAGVVEREYPLNREMVEQANRFPVTSVRVEQLAHKLGEQAKGLNKNRVDYLRRRGLLSGEWDDVLKVWTYELGSVLDAHRRAKESRRRAADA